jgi:glyoxylase I family protein
MAVSRIKIKRTIFFGLHFTWWDSADIHVSRSTKLKGQMAIDVRGLAPLLSVFDMPTSIKFYCDGLGFEVVGTDGKPAPRFDWALLRLDSAELMLNTAYDADERPSVPDPARIAAHQDAALYFGCPDVEGAYAHLREKGIKAKEPKIAPYGMKQLYLTDPDGYLLCFQWQAEKQTGAI